jgi:dTDP-4-amino-4,6-dideoxygalactose transaminase
MYLGVLPYPSLDSFLEKKSDYWDSRFGKNCWWFNKGRDALWWGIKHLGLLPDDEVLMPASICEVVLAPLMEAGIRIKYYGLNLGMEFDPAEIERKITPGTKAVYLNYYFGFPQNPDSVKKICEDHSIFLIEDCAHAPLSQYRGKLLGENGDISIFSLRKFLPVWEGGILKVNTAKKFTLDVQLENRKKTLEVTQLAKHLAKGFGQALGLNPAAFIQSLLEYPEWEDRISLGEERYNESFSPLIKKILRHSDPASISLKRRQNFKFWMERFTDLKGAKPVYSELPDGVVPYSFPFLSTNQKELYGKLSRMGVYLEPTFNYTFYSAAAKEDHNEKFMDVAYLADRLLSLPVHQNLTPGNLEMIWRRLFNEIKDQ